MNWQDALKMAKANQEKFEKREHNYTTHDEYLLPDGRYKCRACGGIEFDLGDNPCTVQS
jgi:hypothetical protein